MPYPSNRTLDSAILALLRMHRLDHYWGQNDLTPPGPTLELLEEKRRMDAGESALGAGEQVILRICLDLWSQGGGVSLADILLKLNPIVAHSIGELLMALGDEAAGVSVSEWILKWHDFDAKALDPA